MPTGTHRLSLNLTFGASSSCCRFDRHKWEKESWEGLSNWARIFPDRFKSTSQPCKDAQVHKAAHPWFMCVRVRLGFHLSHGYSHQDSDEVRPAVQMEWMVVHVPQHSATCLFCLLADKRLQAWVVAPTTLRNKLMATLQLTPNSSADSL